MSNKILTLKNVSKHYRQGNSIIRVLDDLNLNINEGELIAIIGSSGSGKSTLLHIAGLLDKPTNGEVIIANNEYKTNHLIRLNYLGFIYQQHHLLKDFTAIENVIMPSLINGSNQKEAIEAAKSILDSLGLGKKLHNMPGELSGGEQQRVAIARSLINKPKIILADEPTGNLDPKTTNEVFNLFLKVAKEQNTAIVMVTHNHELAHRMDKLYKLKHGALNMS
ncbi:ABC transporter ATP-binding protein [Rickettsia bellii]|uniref:ABC transporter family protein n=1 Tax=Rickettsia bellii str. RML Mogi TaxID=1359194 RepID=A0A0F3QLS5_RICBE|nr:ABC transporter ATP-binding protein [Rickettsia bellii]KJV92399.1 ABC transporter family protein [Rickettsia bellii str. RML Mogi]